MIERKNLLKNDKKSIEGMASRKHCLDEMESEDEPMSKRIEFEPSQDILIYNPTCLTLERTSLNCPGYTVEELRKIGRRLGIAVRGLSKSDLVTAIRTRPL